MKFALAALTLVLANQALACQAEAQFIAQVASTKQLQYACELRISPPRLFNESQVCPLQLDEVLGNPILVGAECPAVGTEISGYLIQNEDGQIVLD